MKWAYDKWNSHSLDSSGEQNPYQRWAIGYVFWKKLVKYVNSQNVHVYFIRTDFRVKEQDIILDDDNFIGMCYDKPCGELMYKTLAALKLFETNTATHYDYVIRGNLNAIIDIYTLNNYVQSLPTTNVFGSPFWEGGVYPFGYFFIISRDIVKYLTAIDFNSVPDWSYKPLADDYTLTMLILKSFNYYIMCASDIPWINTSMPKPPISTINEYGIRFYNSYHVDDIISTIKTSSNSIFVYRLWHNADKRYIKLYKFLLNHILHKIVEQKVSELDTYDTYSLES